MSKELIVNSSAHQTRLAILEDDQLVEIHVEQQSQHVLAGSIYKGRVTRVLPGMQSAFVDIGLDRDAFLYVSDFFEENEEYEGISVAAKSREEPVAVERATSRTPEEQAETESAPAKRERRDRRRRSRRRRERRSDFPESKYASVAESRQKETPRAPEPTPAGEATSEPDFTVLPGESLAKYGERSDQPAPANLEDDRAMLSGEESAGTVESGDDSGAFLEGRAAHDGGRERPAEPAQPNPSLGAGPKAATSVPDFTGESRSILDADSCGPQESFLDRATAASASRATAATAPEATEEPNPDPSLLEKASPTDDGAGSIGSDEQAPQGGVTVASETSVLQTPTGTTARSPFRESADERPMPALPKPIDEFDSNETSAEGKGTQASVDEDLASTDEAETSSPQESGEASSRPAPSGREEKNEVRLRGRSGSARYVRRRGRRGRRRVENSPAVPEVRDAARAGSDASTEDGAGRKITDLLAKGQEVLVQIAKEPLGRKGARITSHIALPGRFLVYMPTVEHVGVSRKIASDKERLRLRKIVQTHRTGMPGGFIVRTAGEGVEEEDIRGDMLFLYNLWLDIKEKAERSPAASLIHHDDDVVERVLRDRLGEEFKTIWVDDEKEYERILRFVERFQPELLRAVKLFTRTKPIFDEFNITGELEKALRPKVWLKSGGYIVINPTEALVAIDVNTGKYVGKSDSLEDTIVNTNLEAVNEIVRQLRIRDLGGIIVVDFIDMEDRPNRLKVTAALEKELRQDIAPSKVLAFNEFGLVAITRKRVKQSLERSLCTPCPYCHGAAYVKSVPTVIQEILTEAKKMATTKEPKKDMTLRVNPEVGRRLKSKDNNYLPEIEQILRARVLVRSDGSLHREHFDIH